MVETDSKRGDGSKIRQYVIIMTIIISEHEGGPRREGKKGGHEGGMSE